MASTPSPNSTADYENDPDIPLPTYITWISIASFSASGIVGIALYIPIVVVIIKKREKFLANSFYKFLLSLGVAEIISLFVLGFFESFCLLRGWQLGTSGYCPVPLLFNYAMGAVSWIVYGVEFFLHPLIAFDRLMAICFYNHYSTVLAEKYAIAMCVIAWLGVCMLQAPIIGGYFPVAFFNNLLGPYVDNPYAGSAAYALYNLILNTYLNTTLAVCALLYAVCCVVLVVRRQRSLAVAAKNKDPASEELKKAQRKLTIQAAAHFGWLATYQILWAAMANVSSIWLFFAMNMVEQIVCMNTPIITLWLNVAIREEVVSLFKRKGKSAPVAGANQWATKRTK